MAKELVVWCDVCLKDEDTRTPSSTYVIQVKPIMKQPMGIDLCAR